MKNTCVEVSVCGEKLHRLFLDLIKIELDSLAIDDINSLQALTLINIGENTITMGELTAKGYYIGSNASYNTRKMIANDYLIQEASKYDKRSYHVKLSEKGLTLLKRLCKGLEKYNSISSDKEIAENYLLICIENMKKISSVWKERINGNFRHH
jgi:DNA-binding MarR family transcriptional regulator